MLVKLYNMHEDREVNLYGTPEEIERKLLAMFPHLDTGNEEHAGDVLGLLDAVDSMQSWSVDDMQFEGHESMHGPEDDPDYGASTGTVREVVMSPDLMYENAGPMRVSDPEDE